MARRLALLLGMSCVVVGSNEASAQVIGPFSDLSGPGSGQFRWSGFYAGLHGGWGRGVVDGITAGGPTEDSTRSTSEGGFFGGQLGANYQLGQFVFGWEVSGSLDGAETSSNCFANTADSHVVTGGGGAPGFSDKIYRCNAERNWTLQGLARALVGLVLGGGMQYALTNTLSLGLEYLHVEYDGDSFASAGHFESTSNFFPPTSGTYSTSERIDLQTDTIRAVLNYKFTSD